MLTTMPTLNKGTHTDAGGEAQRVVEIDSCALVSDGAFCALWEHRLKMDMGEITGELMANITHLEITRCPGVTGSGVKYAIMALSGGGGAKEAAAAGGGGGERGERGERGGGRCLESLKFASNGMLRQEAVVLAARRLKEVYIKDAGALTSLTLTGCASLEKLTIYNSLQVREIEIEAPQLHSLSLASCKVLLQLKVVAPALSSLNLHGCRLLDTLLLHSPRLTVVNMYGCLAVGDRAVHTLLTAAEDSLQEVVLDGLVKVECLRLAAPKLDKLCVKGCATLATLRLDNAGALRALDVRGCNALQFVDVDAACATSKVALLGAASFRT